ncbi:MAG: ribosomal protein S6--L-glutamate ligase [Candidatus Aldehydirespiratoraceae bacterium]|jgi:ribosomal protein S6--L-glutamate ligase
MKLAILSRAPRSYSTQRLVASALERGHKAKVFDTLRFAIDLAGDEPDLQYRGKPLADYDAILPRIGASITFFGLAVVRQFEQMDTYTPSTSNGIANSRDKLRSIQILSRHGVQIPATTFARDRADVLPAIERVGGAPVVIKLLEGTQGIGVILAPDTKVAEAVIETLQSTKQNVLIQRFIAESRGKDLRAFVIGDRVVAAMRRTAQGDEFRSNVHRGGSTEMVELSDEAKATAVSAAQIMGLRVAGVDMLESDLGPMVMEVNSSPGLEGIEGATGLDIAGAIVDYIANQVAFPEVDVRQRLGVSASYGVAEIAISEGADLLKQNPTVGELRDLDITVLTLHRGTTMIPNPRDDRELLVDDRLLCFGRLDNMRNLVPERRRRRARPNLQPLPDEPIPTELEAP